MKKLSPYMRKKILNEVKEEVLKNMGFTSTLESAILGFNPGSIGTQVNQVDTLQLNLRYYLISNFRQLLSEAYVEKGLVQTIIDEPVNDGFRGGIEIKTKQIDTDQCEYLNRYMEEQNDFSHICQAVKWKRLFGGSGVLLITDQDPMTPLDIEAISEDRPFELRAVDMWELFWTKQNTEDYSAAIDQQDLSDVEFYNYYAQQVHKSRVRKMKGKEAPSFVRPRLRGWGLSCLEPVIDGLNQYLKAINLVFEVLDEFKIDVYKIKNLANTLINPQGAQKVQQRIQLANKQKNFQNAIAMDVEDDYIQKELSFTGIAETMEGIRLQIASELRMPLSKIFGIPSSGFSSGEDDIENYNAMIESEIRQKIKHDVVFIVKLRCQQLFGFLPDDLTIEFKPLRILSSEQEQNVKNAKHQRLMSTVQSGLMTVEEYKDACNKDNLLSVQLDTSIDKLEPIGGASSEGESSKGKESATKPEEAKA